MLSFLIEAALEYSGDTHIFEDIVDGIRKGTMQFGSAKKVHSHRNCGISRKTYLNIFLAGGELEQILDMDSDVKAWCIAQGCGEMMSGRIGGKTIKAFGLEARYKHICKGILNVWRVKFKKVTLQSFRKGFNSKSAWLGCCWNGLCALLRARCCSIFSYAGSSISRH